MIKIALTLATFVTTYCVASLVQTVFHRAIGHMPHFAKLYNTHVKGHHAQCAREVLFDRWIPTGQHVTRYYAIPFIPIVCAAYCLLPGFYFIVHLCGLGFATWWHVYLHRQYHLRGVWRERFAWFQEKRRLHFVHHQNPQKNFAIVEFSWDLLFGTFDDGFVAETTKIQQSYNFKGTYENRIDRYERCSRAQRRTHQTRPHAAGIRGPQPDHCLAAKPWPAHARGADTEEI